MELQAKLLRAHVWLSQRALNAQDGFLAVTRVAEHETLAYGSLDDDLRSDDAAQRKYRSVALKWVEREERETSAAKAFQLLQDEEPSKFEFLLFMLQAPAADKAKDKCQQRIVYVGKSVLRPSTRDVDAMRTQHELVFSTTLDGGLGSLDVKLKRRLSDSEKQQKIAPEIGDASDARSSFSVNWSSSEALKKDLEVKARLKAEGEQKLLLQLRKVFVSALHATKLRDKELRRQRFWWAAAKIQRALRAILNRRREELERVRREQLAAQEARKARVKEKVVERNLKRAQAMREQLRSFKAGRSSSPDNNNNNNNSGNRNAIHNDSNNNSSAHADQSRFATIKAEKQSIELAKLQRRLTELEAERAEVLLQKKRTSERRPETTSRRYEHNRRQQLLSIAANQHTMYAAPQRTSGGTAGNALLDADLVRAIRTLHFSSQRKW